MKYAIFTVSLLLALAGPASAGAAQAIVSFSYDSTRVAVGGTFDLSLRLEPRNEKVYTVKAVISFPPDILEARSFRWERGWLAVPEQGYDLIDNRSGRIVKTAGLPLGSDKTSVFGTVTFKVKASGAGAVRLTEGSLALDGANSDTLGKPFPSLAVTAVPLVPEPRNEPAALPAPAIAPAAQPAVAPSAPGETPAAPPPLFDVSVRPAEEKAPPDTASLLAIVLTVAGLAVLIGGLAATSRRRRRKISKVITYDK